MQHQNASLKKKIFFMFMGMICCQVSVAHDLADIEKMSGSESALFYLQLGYEHILPMGLDHILFVLSLFLLSPKLKPILWQSLAFTIAHSVTLALAMYNVINPAAEIVEPLIALSIMYVALENIISPRLKTSRIIVVCLFGLLHGMGFAGALQELGLPKNSYLASLVMFNAGVELGQLTVILAAYFLVGKWLGNKPVYRKAVVIPVSVVIAVIATFWTVERVFY